MADVPVPLESIPPERREVLRRALVELRRDGVDLSVRVLLERARAIAGAGGAPRTQHVGWALAAYRAGRFPLDPVDAAQPTPEPAPPAAPPPAAAVTSRLQDQPHGGALVRREPASLPPPPRGAPTPDDLALLIAGMDDHTKTLDAANEVGRAIALGAIDPKRGAVLLDVITEARQSIKGKALEGAGEVEDFLPATAEAVELVALFEGITDDDRRENILALVSAELEADQVTGPCALGQASTGGTA